MEESVNYEKKYRTLKKKHKSLVTDKEGIDQQLVISKKRIIRLQKERSFLLDRLLQHEQVSSDSESEHSSSSSSDDRDSVDIVRPAKKVKRAPIDDNTPTVRVNLANGGSYNRRVARPRAKSENSEEQTCIARGKDKPCKSKALQGFKYCWHHAPMDPATGFIFCQYRDANKRNAKKCNIPVHKDKPEPFCNYHVKRLQKQHNQAGHHTKSNNNNNNSNNNLSESNGGDHVGSNNADSTEVYQEDIFSDHEEGNLDDSGSGEETSPPRFSQGENVVIN